VFAWGATAYELLTGERAFGTDEDIAIMHCIVHEEPEDLAVRCPDVSEDLLSVIQQALAKEPAERYVDA
jgi:eukaryotic-like serine/threonine-protein kinase